MEYSRVSVKQKTWDLRKTKNKEKSETEICKKGTPAKVFYQLRCATEKKPKQEMKFHEFQFGATHTAEMVEGCMTPRAVKY